MADAELPNRVLYEPPTGDEPLDVIELALARALARMIVREIQDGQRERRPAIATVSDAIKRRRRHPAPCR